jgi:hypothetical protein
MKGGAALKPLPEDIWIAPMRTVAELKLIEARAGSNWEPWDPWQETRIGYDTPAPASLFLPPPRALDQLLSYLRKLPMDNT